MIILQTNFDYVLMKRKNIYILLLLIPVLFASCKVGKSYVRPEMALPDSLAQQQDSASIADEQWQAVYTDNTLRSLIDRALEYNKDMLIAAARVKEMAAQKRISVANLLPQLNGRVEAEREVENHGGHSRDVGNTYEAKALLSWELDLWGNLRWKKAAAVAEYLQSVEAQRALRMTIVSEVAQAYYELVALDTELEIVRQTQKHVRKECVSLEYVLRVGLPRRPLINRHRWSWPALLRLFRIWNAKYLSRKMTSLFLPVSFPPVSNAAASCRNWMYRSLCR